MASNITDHAASEQHKFVMLRLWTEQVKAACVPIAERSLISKILLALEKSMQEKWQWTSHLAICVAILPKKPFQVHNTE